MAELASTGYLSKMGVGVEANYGVPVAVTQAVALVSENIPDDFTQLPDATLQGRRVGRPADHGTQSIKGDVVVACRYLNSDLLAENFFGSFASGVYRPILTTWDTSCTMAWIKRGTIWELAGVKVNKIVVAVTAATVYATFSIMATSLTRSELASTVNTKAMLDDLVINTATSMLLFDMKVRLADRSGPIPQDAGYPVSQLTLTMDRPMDEVYDNTSHGVTQPLENAKPTTMFTYTIPRHTEDQVFAWRDAQTRLQSEIVFTAGAKKKAYLFPEVAIVTSRNSISGPGALPLEVTTECYEQEDVLTSTSISAQDSDNSLNIDASSATKASGTLTLTGVGTDAETVTINGDVYELDTEPGSGHVGVGRIEVDVSGNTTKQAKGTLTIATNVTAGDTMTIDTKLYTFDANGSLSNVNGHIEVGTTVAATRTNIVNAINRTGTPGTGYAAVMTKHTSVSIAAFAGSDAVITANKGGTAGNSIATTETFTAGGNVFDAATLGTTQAGVSPPASEVVTALVASIMAAGTAPVSAAPGGGTSVVVTADDAGSQGNSIVTTETMANASWGAATLTGGAGTVATFPFCYAGSTVWVNGLVQGGGVAEVVSWELRKLLIKAADLNLSDEVAGASVTVTFRSYDVQLTEV